MYIDRADLRGGSEDGLFMGLRWILAYLSLKGCGSEVCGSEVR